ncbi:MAG: hypothetical protein O7C62_08755 [Rickettsia endosymbiont of Ixodes persulcatus]|nr:hypothetical protein [Rickettsia endosymbiont of Ixodes persulcatus]
MKHLFYSLISIVIALYFILIGIVGVIIPWSIEVRRLLTKLIFEDSLAISLFGFAFFFIGLAILINICLHARRTYYKIHSKKGSTTIDETVVQQYLTTYWKQLFPNHPIPCHVVFKQNRIHVEIDFPHLPLPEQKPFFEWIL